MIIKDSQFFYKFFDQNEINKNSFWKEFGGNFSTISSSIIISSTSIKKLGCYNILILQKSSLSWHSFRIRSPWERRQPRHPPRDFHLHPVVEVVLMWKYFLNVRNVLMKPQMKTFLQCIKLQRIITMPQKENYQMKFQVSFLIIIL